MKQVTNSAESRVAKHSLPSDRDSSENVAATKRQLERMLKLSDKFVSKMLRQYGEKLGGISFNELATIYQRFSSILHNSPGNPSNNHCEVSLQASCYSLSREFKLSEKSCEEVLEFFKDLSLAAIKSFPDLDQALAYKDYTLYSLPLGLALHYPHTQIFQQELGKASKGKLKTSAESLNNCAALIHLTLVSIDRELGLGFKSLIDSPRDFAKARYRSSSDDRKLTTPTYRLELISDLNRRVLTHLGAAELEFALGEDGVERGLAGLFHDIISKPIATATGMRKVPGALSSFVAQLIIEKDQKDWPEEIHEFAKTHRIPAQRVALVVELTIYLPLGLDREENGQALVSSPGRALPKYDAPPRQARVDKLIAQGEKVGQELIALAKEKRDSERLKQLGIETKELQDKEHSNLTRGATSSFDRDSETRVTTVSLAKLTSDVASPVSTVDLAFYRPLSSADLKALAMIPTAQNTSIKLSSLVEHAGDLKLVMPAYARELASAQALTYASPQNIDRHELLVSMLTEQIGFFPALEELATTVSNPDGFDPSRISSYSPIKALRVVNTLGAHISSSFNSMLLELEITESELCEILKVVILNQPEVRELKKFQFTDDESNRRHSFQAELVYSTELRKHQAVTTFLAPWFFHYLSAAVPSLPRVVQRVKQDSYSLSVVEDGENQSVEVIHNGTSICSSETDSLSNLIESYRSNRRGLTREEIYRQERIDEARA